MKRRDLMRFKLLVLFFILVTLFIVGCSEKQYQTNFQGNQQEEELVSDNFWFSKKNYTLTELEEEKVLKEEVDKVSEDKLLSILEGVEHFSGWELFNPLSKHVILYQFEDIDYFKNEGEKEISYYRLPKEISGNSFYSTINEISVVMDYDSNIMRIYKNGIGQKNLIKAIQFVNGVSLNSISLVGGFCENNLTKLLFKEGSNIHIFNYNTLDVKSINFNEWKVLSLYTEPTPGYLANEHAYLYLFSQKDQIIKKIKLPGGELVSSYNLMNIPIKGEPLRVENDGMGELFLLTRHNNETLVYSCDENTFKQYSLLNDSFVNIDDIRYYAHNEKEIYLIVFDKTARYPLNKISTTGEYWVPVDKS